MMRRWAMVACAALLANCAGPVKEASLPAAGKPERPARSEEPARPERPAERPAPKSQPKPVAGDCGGKLVRSAFYWQGRKTASGAPFDPNGMTAAHRTLPFGTRLTVTNPRTGKSVVVVVNDRGPFTPGLHLDLARGAARAIGLTGTGQVCIT